MDYTSPRTENVEISTISQHRRPTFEHTVFHFGVFLESEVTMEAYQIRFIEEYKQLKRGYSALHKMLIKYEAGTLPFEFKCPVWLLEEQASIMARYLTILEVRAELDGLDLENC